MTEPVHVMHVVHTLRTGGMEMGVVKLANGLDRARVRSSICSTTAAGEIKALIDPAVPVIELARRAGADLRIVFELAAVFRRARPDVVHTHAWGTLLEGLAAARLARVPAVIHGEHGTLQLKAHQRWLQRAGWSAVDRLLSVSSVLAARMAEQTGFPLSRVTVIRNGVHLTAFERARDGGVRESFGVAPSTLLVGAGGRLVPVKDHATLIAAAAVLRQTGLPVAVVIAGDGPLLEPLRQQAQSLGVELHLLGYRTDVAAVLGALDVFVSSSVSEGLSNTILEAMAASRPVVATRVGGTEEMVVDGVSGLLVPAGDPEAMAAALRRVLSAPDRGASMGAAGRARVEQEFTLDSMMGRYESLYLDVAGRRGNTETRP
jgi:sugar transferase (PEP-CTERM/EpsH1 system associated)